MADLSAVLQQGSILVDVPTISMATMTSLSGKRVHLPVLIVGSAKKKNKPSRLF